MEMLEDDMKHGHNMSLEYAAIYTDLLENPDKALEYIQQDQTLRPDNIDINRRLAKIYMLKKTS